MKKMLVKVINNTVSGKVRRRSLIEDLKVDLENCESCKVFKGKYTKKLYGDDLFLFVNEDFKLIGCTIGAIYQKEFEQYTCYYRYNNFRKNRSGLEEHSKLIIRVPAEARVYSKRFNKKYTSATPKLPSLRARLINYKNKKNEEVNDEKEFEAKVKEELVHEKEHHLEDEFMDKVLEAAAKNMKVEINPEIVEEEVHRMINQYAEQLKMQGMDFNEFMKITGTKEEDLHKQMEPEAEKRVKYRFMLEAIAEKEDLKFTKEEVEARADEIAASYGVDKSELLKAYGSMDVIEYDMKMHKALEILKENN